MAPSFAKYSILISLPFLFVFICPSLGEKHSKLIQLCSKTTNPHWCLHLMKNDSRTAHNKKAIVFTEVAMDLAHSLSKTIRQMVNSANDKEKDSEMKFKYNLCSKNYEDAIRDLEQSKKLFKHNNDSGRVEVQVNDALEEVRDCKNQIEKSKGDDASNIKRRTQELELLCDVIKVSFTFK